MSGKRRRSSLRVNIHWRAEQLYIEPNGMIAEVRDGTRECAGLDAVSLLLQKGTEELMGLPAEKVRIMQAETGGALREKEEFPFVIAGHAALLAWKSVHPVKTIYDREEDMATTTKRHPSRARHKPELPHAHGAHWPNGGAESPADSRNRYGLSSSVRA